MQVDFTPDQREFIERAIASGRIRREEDAVSEALSLWEERERKRIEILACLDEAEADLASGRFSDYADEDTAKLAQDLKLEGRAIVGLSGPDGLPLNGASSARRIARLGAHRR